MSSEDSLVLILGPVPFLVSSSVPLPFPSSGRYGGS